MKQFTYTIQDALGFHARPAGMFAKLAKSFADTTITLSANGKSINPGQLMKMMGMGIKQGCEVTLTCEGANEEQAAAELKDFLEKNL